MSQTETFTLLKETADKRRDDGGVKAIRDIANLYEGNLPQEYAKYFPANEPKHIINMGRLAHDDLATTIGRMPDIRGEPINQTNQELKKVGLIENIAFSYLNSAEPSPAEFMWELAWWMLTGRAVVLVRPDSENKKPVPTLVDPRTTYPGVKRRSGNRPMELTDCLFEYEIDEQEASRMDMVTLRREPWRTGKKVKVYEYVDDVQWLVASETGYISREEHGLGFVPARVFQTFSPNSSYGLSQFQDQITLMVAISRIISQKLAFGDRVVYPMLWVKGDEGQIKIGPHTVNKLSSTGEIGSLSPSVTLQADRDVEMLERFSRILNRNTEVRQGEIQSKASYTSAKTLEQLSEAIDTVVGRYWDTISSGLEDVLEMCFKMDQKLWPNEEKSIYGVKKGHRWRDAYTPSVDIDRTHVDVHYGFGVGGYQGFLQITQANQAGFFPKRRAMEEMPGVSDVDQLLREIEVETMDEIAVASFKAQAAQGQLDMLLWGKLRKEMARKGIPLVDVMEKYNEEIQAQAQAAQAAQTGMGALTVPEAPMPPEEMGGETSGEPPLPPGLDPMALMAGA
ncbi:MAG: phage portal protein [Dehalococcoidales bacterium]|nr:phage portal protein [Dehalococcoidales bacterium]